QGRVDCLTGDILARHAFAEALDPAVEPATNDDVVRVGARVRSVTNRLPQRNAHMKGSDFDNAHGVGLGAKMGLGKRLNRESQGIDSAYKIGDSRRQAFSTSRLMKRRLAY